MKKSQLDKNQDDPRWMIVDPAPPFGPIGHLFDWCIKNIFKGK